MANRIMVTAQSLRIRSGPGTTFNILTTVNQGTVLEVVELVADWYKVRYTGGEGYVAAGFVEPIAENALTGYLIENAELMSVDLVPERQIPTMGLTTRVENALAATWNQYGNLMAELGRRLEIPVSGLVGVLVAESGGRVFGADGKMIIRFEVHLFFRSWGERNPNVFNRHFRFDTSSPRNNWKNHEWRPNEETPWAAVHTSQTREWEVLALARNLNDTAALTSISMGAPQVLGSNFKRLGYESVQMMFDQFAVSAHAQLLGMFDFVKGAGASSQALQALRSKDYFTFASIYNGPGNAETYRAIIQERADVYDRLIETAIVVPRVVPPQRGPVEAEPTPAPTDGTAQTGTPTPPVETPREVVTPPSVPVVPATPAAVPTSPLSPLSPSGATAVGPSVVASTPIAPPENAGVVFTSTDNGVNVRSEPIVKDGNVIERLTLNEPVTVLEDKDQALAKMMKGKAGGEFLKIRTNEGREGYAAAWLLSPSGSLVRETIDNYINSIQDNYPLPAEYEQFWSMQDKLGLPDPFNVLPVQVRSANKLVNMQVNCFGPNTFAARNWRSWYSRIGGMHNGSDFIVETGTPLLAVADGVVIRSWPFMGDPKDKSIVLWPFMPDRFKDAQGRRVMSNILVAYGHMSNNSMHAEGAVLKAGDVIGLSGTPGGSGYNDHLHFEVHLLTGDKGFLNLRALGARKLLAKFNRAQPYSNQMPWNTLLFYSKRLVKYQVHQSRVIGYNGMPSYPTFDMLRNLNASHLAPLDEFTVAYWEYPKAGTAVCWEPQTPPFPRGVVTMKDLPARLANFESFQPFDNPFAK